MPLLILLACADREPVDSGVTAEHACAALPEPEEGSCDGVYEVTWSSWGDGFVRTQCQGCHASTTPDRFGAPEASTFDSVEDVCEQRDRIQARVLDDETMPPAGGLTDDDKLLLQMWLDCWLPYEVPAE